MTSGLVNNPWSQIGAPQENTSQVPPIIERLTAAQAAAAGAQASTAVAAPVAINAATVATLNGARVRLSAGTTLTVDGGAWAGFGAGIIISVQRTGSATLAFSGGAVKENAAGTSGSSVTLTAAGEYVVQQGFATPQFRLSGGAVL